jgi:hypothetical protein
VAAYFKWGPIAPNAAPAPLVEVTLTKGHRIRLIKGLFDTGADHACLRLEWKERLRVQDSECFELDLTGICGKDNPIKGLATVVDATFDGHNFRLPVAFAKELPVDLFGRFGLLERWKVHLDSAAGMTTFEWTDAAAPLADYFEKKLQGEVVKKAQGTAQASNP